MKRLLPILFMLAFPIGAVEQPISVKMISPTNGSTVSGVINLTAQCSDNVVKVEFYRDDILIATVYRPNRPKEFRIANK